ncbi:MAG: GtrA family protein [Gammaproteobacteria bacterium]|nr:GtrA family protein [Gammaproteobacteria bacterium]
MNRATIYQRIPLAGVSGALATATHYVLFFALIGAGIPPLPASGIGSAGGALCNYLGLYYFAYRCQTPHRTVLRRYLGVISLSLLANPLLFGLLHMLAGQTPLHAQLATTAIIWVLNLCLYDKQVFNRD